MPVVGGLRRRDWTVTTAAEEGTLGAPDREHLEYATERGWTVLTFDDDFLSLVDAVDVDHAGIIYVSQHGKTSANSSAASMPCSRIALAGVRMAGFCTRDRGGRHRCWSA